MRLNPIILGFLKKTGRELRIRYRDDMFTVTLDGLPKTECLHPWLPYAVAESVIKFLIAELDRHDPRS